MAIIVDWIEYPHVLVGLKTLTTLILGDDECRIGK
jgi:hypothetical protein